MQTSDKQTTLVGIKALLTPTTREQLFRLVV